MKKNNLMLLGVGVSLTFALLFFSSGYIFQVFQPGLTVTSISTTDVISSDKDLAGTWFLIDTTIGGGQSIVGTITEEEFEQLSGYETEYPLEIDVTTYDEVARYNIKNDRAPVYDYMYEVLEPLDLFTYTFPECSRQEYSHFVISNEDKLWWEILKPPFLKVCVYRDLKGVKGHMEQTSTPFNADITLTVHGEEITKTISSTQTSVNFYSGSELVATAQWTGSLVTGDQPPDPSPYVTIWKQGNEIWGVIKEDMYDNYLIERQSVDKLLKRCESDELTFITNCPTTETELLQELTNVKAYATYLLTANDINSFNSEASIINQGQEQSYLDVPLDTRINVPTITFKVRASWIGVRIPVAQPLITSVSCPTFESGSDGTISLNVKNIGSSEGTFYATLEDCGKIQPKYSATLIGDIQPGNIRTVNIPIILQEQAAEGNELCNLRVYDFNNPSNDDTIDVRCYWTVPSLPTCNFNDVCEPLLGETIDNCPDCGSPSPKEEDIQVPVPLDLPLEIIFSVLVGAGTFFFLGSSTLMNKRKDYGKIIGYLILGIGIGLISWLILSNIVTILIILGVSAFFGGVALWLGGGIILSIITTIVLIKRKLKK